MAVKDLEATELSEQRAELTAVLASIGTGKLGPLQDRCAQHAPAHPVGIPTIQALRERGDGVVARRQGVRP